VFIDADVSETQNLFSQNLKYSVTDSGFNMQVYKILEESKPYSITYSLVCICLEVFHSQ